MAKASRRAGSTSNIFEVFIQDSSATTGVGLTGLAYNTSGLACYYKRDVGTAAVSVSLANITTLGTFASGGFKAVDGTNMPGVYEFHPPDAALASGAKNVVFILRGAANMAPTLLEIELTATDNQDGTAGGISRLDAAVSSRSTFDHTSNQVIVGTNNDKTGYALSGTQAFNLTGNINGSISGSLDGSVGSVTGNVGGNVVGSVGSVTGSVGSVTGNVGGNVIGSVGSLAAQAKADVNAEVDAAIETYHLDHLLAATYDPASKPGAADALLNELVENDSGVARFTANALEQAPTGGSAPTVEQIRTEIDANSTQLAAIRADTEDLQTQIGTAGAGLTALGDTRIANLDATVSSRLASASYSAAPTTGQIAAAILATPANLLATDGSGRVTVGSNADKTGYSLASPPPSAADNATAVWAAEARALTDKAGFALAAGGLDAIPTTAPAGVAGNFREMIVQLWRRAFKRSTLTATQLVTYADDGSTAITTQAVSDDGDTQTLGAAT
jgi:hypothetical protein